MGVAGAVCDPVVKLREGVLAVGGGGGVRDEPILFLMLIVEAEGILAKAGDPFDVEYKLPAVPRRVIIDFGGEGWLYEFENPLLSAKGDSSSGSSVISRVSLAWL